jgi:hypothetical protein
MRTRSVGAAAEVSKDRYVERRSGATGINIGNLNSFRWRRRDPMGTLFRCDSVVRFKWEIGCVLTASRDAAYDIGAVAFGMAVRVVA